MSRAMDTAIRGVPPGRGARAAVLLAFVAACGDDASMLDGGEPPGDGAAADALRPDGGASCAREPCPIPLDALEDRVSDLWCELLFACPEPGFDGELNLLRNQLQTAERCAAHVQRIPYSSSTEINLNELTGYFTGGNIDWAVVRASVAEGGVTYDPDAAARCIDALRSSCMPTFGPTTPDVCGAVFVGPVPEGSPCGYSMMCAAGLSCQNTDGSGSCDQGTCLPLRPTRAACEDRRECASGYCSSVCFAATLEPPARVGEPCGYFPDDAASELRVAACDLGLWCVRGVCALRRAPGETCVYGDDVCVADHACRVDGAATTCSPAQIGRAAGARCTGYLAGTCDPVLGLACSPDGSTCILVGDGSEGSACSGQGPADIGCDDAAGLTCSDAVRPPPDADPWGGWVVRTCQPRSTDPGGRHC